MHKLTSVIRTLAVSPAGMLRFHSTEAWIKNLLTALRREKLLVHIISLILLVLIMLLLAHIAKISSCPLDLIFHQLVVFICHFTSRCLV